MLGVLLPRKMGELDLLSDITSVTLVTISALTVGVVLVFAVVEFFDHYYNKRD
jgi:hypothetical protein